MYYTEGYVKEISVGGRMEFVLEPTMPFVIEKGDTKICVFLKIEDEDRSTMRSGNSKMKFESAKICRYQDGVPMRHPSAIDLLPVKTGHFKVRVECQCKDGKNISVGKVVIL